MLEGLARWIGGETLGLLVWTAVAAFVAALVWVVMIVWRGGDLPMRSYRDPEGRRHTGALVWLAAFALVLGWLPVGLLAYRALRGVFWATVDSVMWFVNLWPLWLSLALAYGAWRLVRLFWLTPDHLAARRRARDPRYAEPAPELAHDPMPRQPRLGGPVVFPPAADGSDMPTYAPAQPAPENVPDDFYARPQ